MKNKGERQFQEMVEEGRERGEQELRNKVQEGRDFAQRNLTQQIEVKTSFLPLVYLSFFQTNNALKSSFYNNVGLKKSPQLHK